MIFFALGLVLALLGGYIIIGLLQLVFSIIGGILSWIFER